MTDERVRMHLAQAATRIDDPDAYGHVQAALTVLDEPAATRPTHHPDTQAIPRVETALEHWLVEHAAAGVPETVLIDVLRAYADRVERLGHVPRSWHPSRSQSATDNPADRRARHD
jgi:hypothetical protein